MSLQVGASSCVTYSKWHNISGKDVEATRCINGKYDIIELSSARARSMEPAQAGFNHRTADIRHSRLIFKHEVTFFRQSITSGRRMRFSNQTSYYFTVRRNIRSKNEIFKPKVMLFPVRHIRSKKWHFQTKGHIISGMTWLPIGERDFQTGSDVISCMASLPA